MTILTEKQKIMADALVKRANDKQTITFAELEKTSKIDRRGIGNQIGKIGKRCQELGLPIISVLVVRAEDMKTPNGFSKEFYPNKIDQNDRVCEEEKSKVFSQKDWSALLDWETYDNLYPEEERLSLVTVEGKKKTIQVSQYERDPKLRRACIEKYGTTCAVCGFDAAKTYGDKFKGKIHVHHIIPLNQSGQREITEDDLRPVCPNCHMILHSKGGGEVYSIKEVAEMINQNKS